MPPEDAVTVRYNGGKDFEILVHPDEALDYRNGEIDDFEKVLFVREIFKDAGAAEKASAADIEDEFGTKVIIEAAEQLFEDGDLELTTDQRNRIREDTRKQLVSMIARRAMDPQTGNPHPPERVENALEEAGFTVEAMVPAEDQFEDAIDAIKPIIPISLEEKEVAVRIPNEYAGKAHGKVKTMTEVLEEEWGDDAYMARVRMPAGVKPKLETALQKICSGEAELRDL